MTTSWLGCSSVHVLEIVVAVSVLVVFFAWEYRMYRTVQRIKYGCSNCNSLFTEDQKKPPQDESGAVEYGGTRLP